MSITRGEFLRSLGKSLPGLVASTGVATAAEALVRRLAQTGAPPARTIARPSLPRDTHVPFLTGGRPGREGVALTFDDGPVPGVTERILDLLHDHDMHATFFLIGEKVAAEPALARRIVEAGHEAGHHSYSHRKLTELPAAALEDELDRTSALFEQVLGRRPVWFRPPFGALRQDQARRVFSRGMQVVLWNLDGEDWRASSGAAVAEHVRAHLQPGTILLHHELPVTVESLATTLPYLQVKRTLMPRSLHDLMRGDA